MSGMQEFLCQALQERKAQHLYRLRPLIASAQSEQVTVDQSQCLNFSSNDYLGLAAHPQVIASFREAAEKFGVGSGASHLVSGHSTHHHALEEELADWLGRPRALLFSTGYMANLALMDALLDKGDTLYQDRLNHASLIDGGRLSRATLVRYRSADTEHLDYLLQKHLSSQKHTGKQLIATDAVFSMDGLLAPLPELAALADKHKAWLMVDDAHGLGVLGKNGKGSAEHFALSLTELPVLMGTLGKAFGTFGAFVAGSGELIEYLVQFARSYIYTTALPPAVAAATRTSLRLVQQEGWRQEKLKTLIARFRQGIAGAGLELMDSATPIQPILLKDEVLTMQIAQSLRQQGFLVGAIRPPTVPKGTARLRITLSASHTEQQIDSLVQAIHAALQQQQQRVG